MSGTRFLLLSAAFLVAWGLLTSWIAGRSGRDRFGWWVLGTALGPLSTPALIAAVRSQRRGMPRPWPVDDLPTHQRPSVLVATDTLEGLVGAAATAEDRLGWMDHVMTLALVTDADSRPTDDWRASLFERDLCDPLRRSLAGAQKRLPERSMRGEVLFGEAVFAVLSEMRRGGHAVAVIALTRGRGGRKALARIAVRAPRPVLFPLGAPAASGTEVPSVGHEARGGRLGSDVARPGRVSPDVPISGFMPAAIVTAAWHALGASGEVDRSLPGWPPSYEQWPALLGIGVVAVALILTASFPARWGRRRRRGTGRHRSDGSPLRG